MTGKAAFGIDASVTWLLKQDPASLDMALERRRHGVSAGAFPNLARLALRNLDAAAARGMLDRRQASLRSYLARLIEEKDNCYACVTAKRSR